MASQVVSFKRPGSVVTTQTWTVNIAGAPVSLPIVTIKEDLAISLMMIIDMGVSFGVRCGSAIAAAVSDLRPDVVVGAATLGIPVAIEVSRALGLDRYVILQKSPKIHLRDAMVQEIQSITSSGSQRLLLDVDAIPLIAGRRVLVVDDVVASGSSLKGALELVRRAGGSVVGIGVILTEAREWESTLGEDAKLIKGLAHIPQFRLEGGEWKPIESTF
ncbi:putative adenine phosphoribosyltransferase protein [Phaeoacremonium minimum UCRPA7]|uniref:Putative adenine phosphoribosyltransferase protein n=1 Tax=Phaeoacremonium minimum (strain UCR-PA7) TaxID=1286976 RepID=R8B935_PHAM7|nr:putative adenine phosphoribosyltransferase protein [Phaeoacremonium minimum UCRPA7]EON95814.1 putative adenine phosphoribosyltransferase protein [Phaeoacremonium minimum UCRPA7]